MAKVIYVDLYFIVYKNVSVHTQTPTHLHYIKNSNRVQGHNNYLFKENGIWIAIWDAIISTDTRKSHQ